MLQFARPARLVTAGFSLTGGGRRWAQSGGQIPAAGDLELAIRAAEVHLDGLRREVELTGDLAVAGALRRDLRHAALCGRERIRTGARRRTRAAAREQQFRPGAVAHGAGAAGVGGVVGVAQDRARGAPLAGSAPAGAELGQRARVFEPGVAGREVCRGLFELRDGLLAGS